MDEVDKDAIYLAILRPILFVLVFLVFGYEIALWTAIAMYAEMFLEVLLGWY